MNLGDAIRNIRKERVPQLNQTEFANLIGITQTYLSQIENNQKTPNISVLEEVSKVFEIPLPIIFWMSLEESDVPEDKRGYFNHIKPCIDGLIDSFY